MLRTFGLNLGPVARVILGILLAVCGLAIHAAFLSLVGVVLTLVSVAGLVTARRDRATRDG